MSVQPRLGTDNPSRLAAGVYKAVVAAAVALPFLAGVAAAGACTGSFPTALPVVWSLGLAAAVVLAALGGERRTWLWTIPGVVGTVTLAWLLAPVLADRQAGTVFFGGLAVMALWRVVPALVRTYLGCVSANPDVPKGAQPPALDFHHGNLVAGGYLVLMVVAPETSVTSALVLILALSAWVILRHATGVEELKVLATMFKDAAWVWADARDDVRPATWKPEKPRWQRLALLFFTVLAVALTFVISTSYGSCYDAYGAREAEPEGPFAWLYSPLLGLLTQPDPAYRWCAAQALLMTLAVPVLMVFCVMLPALAQVRAWWAEVCDLAASDDRSELDKLLDKGGDA